MKEKTAVEENKKQTEELQIKKAQIIEEERRKSMDYETQKKREEMEIKKR